MEICLRWVGEVGGIHAGLIGRELGRGFTRIVFEYGENCVLKVPNPLFVANAFVSKLSGGTSVDPRSDLEILGAIFPGLALETQVYGEWPYTVEVQEKVNPLRPLTVGQVISDISLLRKLQEIAQMNANLHRLTGFCIDIFGVDVLKAFVAIVNNRLLSRPIDTGAIKFGNLVFIQPSEQEFPCQGVRLVDTGLLHPVDSSGNKSAFSSTIVALSNRMFEYYLGFSLI